jgi:hypothetical protein
MSFLASNLRGVAGCVVLLLALVLARAAHAGGKPEKIQFSDPATPITVSNLNHLDPDKSFRQQLEEDLFRPFHSENSESSFDPVMVPFRRPGPEPMPTRRQRELMEERRNWAFTDVSDLLPKDDLEELLRVKEYGPDGREKESPNHIEKYYEKAGAQPRLTAIELSEMPGAGRNRDFAGTNIFNPASFARSTNEQSWYLSPQEANSNSLPPWAASALNISSASAAEQARAQQQHRMQLNALMEGRAETLAPEPGSVVGTSPFALPALFDPFGKQASAVAETGLAKPAPATPATQAAPIPLEHRNAANPLLGAAADAPVLHPHVLDDPTLRALGLPQPEVKPTPPPKPKKPDIEGSFEQSLPQRKFF